MLLYSSSSGSGHFAYVSSEQPSEPDDLAGLLALILVAGGALGAMGYRRRRTGGGR